MPEGYDDELMSFEDHEFMEWEPEPQMEMIVAYWPGSANE